MSIKVIDPTENSRVPFLRGILTRSLRVAGLSFPEAYRISNKVRKQLSSESEISTEALTAFVADVLAAEGHDEVVAQYLQGPQLRFTTMIHSRDGASLPFSRAHLARSLERCALPPEECYEITSDVEAYLINSKRTELASTELAAVTYQYLWDRSLEDIAQRYLVWLEYFMGQRPLIILLGGTTGSGKSTITAEVAHRLGIVRTQSTDMLREVMRVMLPKRLLPALHASSFTAWHTLPSTESRPLEFKRHFIEGYLTQAREVGVAIEGVLRRAEREQLALILEGVHVFPALQHELIEKLNAIVVPVILAVPKRKQLRQQLKGRGLLVSSRRAERYLEHFDAIWALQSYLLDEAERLDIPMIPNDDETESVQLFMDAISERLTQEYNGNPEIVLG